MLYSNEKWCHLSWISELNGTIQKSVQKRIERMKWECFVVERIKWEKEVGPFQFQKDLQSVQSIQRSSSIVSVVKSDIHWYVIGQAGFWQGISLLVSTMHQVLMAMCTSCPLDAWSELVLAHNQLISPVKMINIHSIITKTVNDATEILPPSQDWSVIELWGLMFTCFSTACYLS